MKNTLAMCIQKVVHPNLELMFFELIGYNNKIEKLSYLNR